MEALFTLAIPAIVKLIDVINKKEWSKVVTILLAALGGAALGYVTGGVNGIVDGIFQIGLAGAGIVTVAGYAGKKANPVTVETK